MAEYHISLPAKEQDIRRLRAGDTVYLSGTIFTMRDAAHEKALFLLAEGKTLPVNLAEGAIYHCGPLMKKKGKKWEAVSAGPTTSARMEMFEDALMMKTGARIIIGKGGMGSRTAQALQKLGGVFCAFTGGCGVLAANAIKMVEGVHWLEGLGMPEALWVFRVENFGPLVVAMDSQGKSLYDSSKK
ncbi:MAG: FumA C-terminus/TtdB family hydratase beta subunit [Candidatus Thermoplasmatota archaeon]|nr:FumA C-terminus/TtdB family hydratase beta subunit [Candidatus Thermoplasmatota archaeon]